MRKIYAILLAALCVTACQNRQEQKHEIFTPIATTDLRLPSVPIVVNDPYFSVWSPFDKLTDGTTRHWTDAEKPLLGLLRVDGTTYRFMGKPAVSLSPIAPMAGEERWMGRIVHNTPSEGWQNPEFDDSKWELQRAAWGSRDLNFISNEWSALNSDIFIRREVELSAEQLQKELFLKYSHDDVFYLYVNGTEVANTGETWVEDVLLPVDEKIKGLLHEGKNIIAAHCHNTTGGAYADFGLYSNNSPQMGAMAEAEQKSVDVLATNTYYTFVCGSVELDLVFTAPMLIDDYDLISTPINYISYQVRSSDGQAHDVQFYLGASPMMAVNKAAQPTRTTLEMHNSIPYLCTGTIDQPILARKGDGICIDWGYFYMPAINGDVAIGQMGAVESQFMAEGKLPDSAVETIAYKPNEMPTMAYMHDFGKVMSDASYTMLGYDEVQDIEYMYHRYKAYYARSGYTTIFHAFDKLNCQYESLMDRCRTFDKMIYDDGFASGGKEYAEILSGSYRHVMAAHKLFQDKDGNMLWFSKENNSNGCVNTVDLTYPEAPLFLLYNPELQKAMMTSIFDYSLSGRWTKPFAAHDLGTYPIANGQAYTGDMPLEEAGNMLTLSAMICKLENSTAYVNKYWDIILTWADYLVQYGQDPANQLCTDDFAGHWAHNANLSLKAICGIAGTAEMARMKGDAETASKLMAAAKEMAAKWEEMAADGDHYKLAFDRPDTWSQKYNIIWDKLWGLNLFSPQVVERELAYYLTVQNKYGLPLDCRRDYTKSDWIMWSAALASDASTFGQFVTPLYNYINETESRVPISDWSDTKTGRMVGFKARSVIGGYWMKVFADKLAKRK